LLGLHVGISVGRHEDGHLEFISTVDRGKKAGASLARKEDGVYQHLTHVNDKEKDRRRHLPIEKRRRRPARQRDDGDEKGHRRGEDQPPEKLAPRALFHWIKNGYGFNGRNG